MNAPYLRFPNERLGNNYSLNWSLVRCGIPPQGNAYRNLHDRHLAMYCEGKADTFKAIHVTSPADSNVTNYLVDGEYEPSVTGSTTSISPDQWTLLMHKVTKHLSENSENLFVQDGAVGSHRSVERKVRVITNSASSALFVKHSLIPTNGTMSNFGPEVYLYHAPNISIKNPEQYGLKDDKPFVVQMFMKGSEALANLNRKTCYVDDFDEKELADRLISIIIVGGEQPLSNILTPLTRLTNFFLLRERLLPLSASTFISSDSQKSTLVFDLSNSLPNGELSRATSLFSSGASICGEFGVYKSLNGVTHQQEGLSRKRGDIVEKVGTSTKIHTSISNDSLAAPIASNIVFIVSDKNSSETRSVAVEEAVKLYSTSLSSLNIEPEAKLSVTGFQSLLETSKPQIFVVNSNNQSSSQVSELVSKIVDGSKPQASSTSGKRETQPPQQDTPKKSTNPTSKGAKNTNKE